MIRLFSIVLCSVVLCAPVDTISAEAHIDAAAYREAAHGGTILAADSCTEQRCDPNDTEPPADCQFPLPIIEGRRVLESEGSDIAFELRGFAYSPVPICEDPAVEPGSALTDPSLIERDAPWMVGSGANAVRTYGAMSVYVEANGSVTSKMGTTPEYLRAVAGRGLWVILGTEIQFADANSLQNASVREAVVEEHRTLVRSVGGEPNILFWAPGNEVNSHLDPCTPENLTAWYGLLDEIARAIEEERGLCGYAGPTYVTGVIGDLDCDGKPGLRELDPRAPSVDVWAINVYRGSSLKTLFEEVTENTVKPFWIAEMGIDSWHNAGGMEGQADEAAQGHFLRALWSQVEKHCDLVFGADIAFYSDEWWKHRGAGADVCVQDPGGGPFGCGPDDFMDEEYLGVMKTERNASDIDTVEPKHSYWDVRVAWRDSTPKACDPRAQFRADFDAPDCNGRCSNNYSGISFGVPAAYEDPGVVVDCTGPGSSGPGHALHARENSEQEYPFFVVVVTLYPDLFSPRDSDLSPWDHLSFDAKRPADAHSEWDVQIEDAKGAIVWGPVSFEIDEIYRRFRWELPALPAAAQITFKAGSLGAEGEQRELDLLIDNLAVPEPKSTQLAEAALASLLLLFARRSQKATARC